MEKPYFHLRDEGFQRPKIDVKTLRRIFGDILHGYSERGYLQKTFGYECVDADIVPGEKGSSLASFLLTDALIVTQDPVWENLGTLEEKQILGIHEVIFHVIARPVGGTYHSYGNCGWHYTTFDVPAGQADFVEAVNKYLRLYPPGYRLTDEGVLELLMEEPASTILDASLPQAAPQAVQERVRRAVRRFRNGLSSWDDRESAVRDLGDVLESIRPEARKHLTRKDEGAMFEILNSFGIRHMREDQREEYDRPVFLTWFFYEMLAAIHACLRLAERDKSA